MVGLSVSLCIKDIANDKVNIENVEKIIGGTKCRNSEEWEVIIKNYRKNYWDDNPDNCERIFRNLLS